MEREAKGRKERKRKEVQGTKVTKSVYYTYLQRSIHELIPDKFCVSREMANVNHTCQFWCL